MIELQHHQYWMNQALVLAEKAGNEGEIPVGAVIIDQNYKLIASAYNQKEKFQDCTAHAEIIAIRHACKKLDSWRLNNCTLYVTLEPCFMCAGAIIHSRLKTLVYAVDDFKTGCIRTVMNLPDSFVSNHNLQVFAGIQEKASRELLQSWFNNRRLYR
ncbi:tRNA-specific adenosine-34 deaminase [Geminocystis sp. NIES-3708]|uniref:tRNA adenosine(34) deaminase TadA n=1 Tax=Geminocystis sp. NIES-3708 TaxID=1615909 RepID=UPI0005FCA456|nr:tRNA adenosine(34) deaminase TadA [Geminocystis sp. NIES-3708]BAQ62457.1 tRNA-specific adenosine-34 deaminase [Geminocystis sp. NIES-3708]